MRRTPQQVIKIPSKKRRNVGRLLAEVLASLASLTAIIIFFTGTSKVTDFFRHKEPDPVEQEPEEVWHIASIKNTSGEYFSYKEYNFDDLSVIDGLDPDVTHIFCKKDVPIVISCGCGESDGDYELETVLIKGHYPTNSEKAEITPHLVSRNINGFVVEHDNHWIRPTRNYSPPISDSEK